MTTLSKVCTRCKTEKLLAEFYIRSGIKEPTLPGHYNSECKECVRERGRKVIHLPRNESRVYTENLAIKILNQNGIGAMPGKTCNAPDSDIVAWGHIWIEVKHARLAQRKGGEYAYTFTTTPKQQQRGFLAHIVMLICEPEPGKYTSHLFDAQHPVFYMDDKVKSALVFTPGLMEARKHANNRTVMTQPLMDFHQDNWQLIEDFRRKISDQLRNGTAHSFYKYGGA